MALKPYWCCMACNTLHEEEDLALECCPVEIEKTYLCPECGDDYMTEETALDCCGHVEPPATAAELEEAGQGGD